jgi:hypothetical protein
MRFSKQSVILSLSKDQFSSGGPATTGVPVLSGRAKRAGGRPVIIKCEDFPATSCGLRPPGQQVVRATRQVAPSHGVRRLSRGHRPPLPLVPKLHLGTQLSAQFHCSVHVNKTRKAEDRQWSCLHKRVPKWSLGTREKGISDKMFFTPVV